MIAVSACQSRNCSTFVIPKERNANPAQTEESQTIPETSRDVSTSVDMTKEPTALITRRKQVELMLACATRP